jgi:hypothetical protein
LWFLVIHVLHHHQHLLFLELGQIFLHHHQQNNDQEQDQEFHKMLEPK